MLRKPLARFYAIALLFATFIYTEAAFSAAPGLEPEAAQPGNQTAARLPEVHLDGTYFTRNGKRFIPMGAHWVPAKADG